MREYHPYFHIGTRYGISASYAYKIIKRVEDGDMLLKDGTFSLPGCTTSLRSDRRPVVLLIDAPRVRYNAPKKTKILYYSGKQQQHSLKTQIGIDGTSKRIIATSFSNAKRHDLRLFKGSTPHIHPEILLCLTDTAYIGIKKFHRNSLHPKNRTKWYVFT